MKEFIFITVMVLMACVPLFAVSIPKVWYETDDIPIANIIPDLPNNGSTDCTKALQSAIDTCSATGGGTVFLPVGAYLLKGSIHVPQGVVLRGDWQDPAKTDQPTYGTVIIARPEPLSGDAVKDTSASPLITVSGNGGIMGITVYYPDQNPESPIPYGFTVQMKPDDGGGVSCSTLRCITLINSYRGISAEYKHELCQLEKIRVCALDKAILMCASTDVGYTSDMRVSPDFWIKAGGFDFGCKNPSALRSYCREHTEGMVLGWLDDETLSELYIDGCRYGIHFLKEQFWGLLYEVHIKDCTTGIWCENLNDWAGAVVSRGEILADEDAVICDSRVGMLKLCGLKIKGRVSGRRCLVNKADISRTPALTHGTIKQPKRLLYVPEISRMSQKPIDISGQLQAALDRAAETGGVVYIPAGIYSLYKPVTVPANVQLCGNSPIFTKDTGSYCGGTVILTYVNKNASVTLSDNAGVNGIRFFYPSFDPVSARGFIDADAPEADSVCIKGAGKGVYVTNSVITAAFTGIDFRGCDGHCIKQVFGVSYLSHIKAGGRNGHIEAVLANIHFTQRHCLNKYFDEKYADRSLNWMSLGAYIRDMVVRPYCTTIKLEKAENESVLNVFMYAPNHLLGAESSSASLINISSDFMYGYQLVSKSSTLRVVNSLRSCGGSVECDDSSDVKILNRIAISYQTETDFDSRVSRIDEYSYKDKIQLSDCETAENTSHIVLTDNPGYVGSGSHAWLRTNCKKGSDELLMAELPITDITPCWPDGRLHITLYVNDYHNLIWGSQIQLASADGVLNWSLPVFIMHKGQNELYMPFESANPSGSFDPTSVKSLRIFAFFGADYDNVFAFDDIFVCK